MLKKKTSLPKSQGYNNKNSVDEYTCEWEALSPRVTDDQRLQTYIHGLKQQIRDELELHNISTMEEARRKAKIIESKSVHTNVNQDDSKKPPLQPGYTGNTGYTPPQLREGTKPSLEA